MDSLHKGPVMPIFDVSLMLVQTSCWTNIWVASNLKCHDILVTPLQCIEENAFEDMWKFGHFVLGPVSLLSFLQEQQKSLSNFTLNFFYQIPFIIEWGYLQVRHVRSPRAVHTPIIRRRVALITVRMWTVRYAYAAWAMDTQWSGSYARRHSQ